MTWLPPLRTNDGALSLRMTPPLGCAAHPYDARRGYGARGTASVGRVGAVAPGRRPGADPFRRSGAPRSAAGRRRRTHAGASRTARRRRACSRRECRARRTATRAPPRWRRQRHARARSRARRSRARSRPRDAAGRPRADLAGVARLARPLLARLAPDASPSSSSPARRDSSGGSPADGARSADRRAGRARLQAVECPRLLELGAAGSGTAEIVDAEPRVRAAAARERPRCARPRFPRPCRRHRRAGARGMGDGAMPPPSQSSRTRRAEREPGVREHARVAERRRSAPYAAPRTPSRASRCRSTLVARSVGRALATPRRTPARRLARRDRRRALVERREGARDHVRPGLQDRDADSAGDRGCRRDSARLAVGRRQPRCVRHAPASASGLAASPCVETGRGRGRRGARASAWCTVAPGARGRRPRRRVARARRASEAASWRADGRRACGPASPWTVRARDRHRLLRRRCWSSESSAILCNGSIVTRRR